MVIVCWGYTIPDVSGDYICLSYYDVIGQSDMFLCPVKGGYLIEGSGYSVL